MDTKLSLDFADGIYTFWLPMSRVIAIEREIGRADKDGALISGSILGLFASLGDYLSDAGGGTTARPMEAHAVIRNALVGGNDGFVNGVSIAVGDAMATRLVQTYCYPADGRPLIHDLGLAWQILRAAIYGIDAGSKKKPVATPSPKRSKKA